jgi:hypothetical protein
MKLKNIFIAGLILLTISRLLMNQGFHFLQAQQPVDFAHWFMLIGVLLLIPASRVFPKSRFNTVATPMIIAGIAAHIGMCAIDFIFWSFGDNYQGRDELLSHLINTPVIWLPFMVIGPSLLYIGLGTQAMYFFKSRPLSAILAIGGSMLIGLGQFMFQNGIIIISGYILFSIGLIFLIHRKAQPPKLATATF